MAASASKPADLCIIGAGWAGLAAALEARATGLDVVLLEASRQPGGRARTQAVDLGFGELRLDNGQHLMMGAYRETLTLIDRLHAGGPSPYARHLLALRDTRGLSMRAPAWSAPMHLAVALGLARGLTAIEKLAAAYFMTRLRLAGWTTHTNETAEALLERYTQPELLRQRLWRPLCLSALNTPSNAACAQTLACVLRDTLGATQDASDFILPHDTLGDCLPAPAVRWLEARGARLAWGATVRRLSASTDGWTAHTAHADFHARALIVAVPSRQAAQLLQSVTAPPYAEASSALVEDLLTLQPAPITTVYAAWPESTVGALPPWTMLNHGESGEWVFDRGTHRGFKVAAIVASNCDSSDHRSLAALAKAIADAAARSLGLAAPAYVRAITDKRATFACTPERRIIGQPALGPEAGFWLAGDYTEHHYPATLESAVRSGRRAASGASEWLRRRNARGERHHAHLSR